MIDLKNTNYNNKNNKKDKYVYILNLNKLRIIIISLSFSILLLLTFLLGFSLGAFSIDKKNTNNENFVDLKRNKKEIKKEAQIKTKENNTDNLEKKNEESEVVKNEETEVSDTNKKNTYTRIKKNGTNKNSQYFIQLLTTNSNKRINYYTNYLRKRGHRSFVKKVKNNKHILSVGIFSTKRKALEELKKLQKSNRFSDAFVKMGYVKK